MMVTSWLGNVKFQSKSNNQDKYCIKKETISNEQITFIDQYASNNIKSKYKGNYKYKKKWEKLSSGGTL